MRRAIGLAAVVLVVGGCGSPATPSSDAESPLASPSATEVRELGAAGDDLEPGRYTRAGFEPRITFQVGEGWTAEQVGAGLIEVQQGVGSQHAIAVGFARPLGSATALEAAEGLAANPALFVSEPEEVTVDGLDGIRIEVETTDPVDLQPPMSREVLTLTDGRISIVSGRYLQVTLLDTPDGVLAILLGGSVANWPITLEIATPVVDSVTIGE